MFATEARHSMSQAADKATATKSAGCPEAVSRRTQHCPSSNITQAIVVLADDGLDGHLHDHVHHS